MLDALETLADYRDVFVVVCTALVLFRGVQLKCLRLYPSFYFFVSSYLLSIVVTFLAAGLWGTSSIRYLHVYIGAIALTHLATAGFLVSLVGRASGLTRTDILLMAFFFSLSTAFELAFPEGHFVWHLSRGGYLFLMLTAVLAVYRCLTPIQFQIGKNLGIALVSTCIMLTLLGLNAHFYLASEWAFENFSNLQSLGDVLSWGLMAWGMWDLNPPSKRNA